MVPRPFRHEREIVHAPQHATTRRLREPLIGLSVWLAGTPCGSLRSGSGFPDRAVASVVARALGS